MGNFVYFHMLPKAESYKDIFYVGCGNDARIKMIKRNHNQYHINIVNHYGADNIKIKSFKTASFSTALHIESIIINKLIESGVFLCNYQAFCNSDLKYKYELKKFHNKFLKLTSDDRNILNDYENDISILVESISSISYLYNKTLKELTELKLTKNKHDTTLDELYMFEL